MPQGSSGGRAGLVGWVGKAAQPSHHLLDLQPTSTYEELFTFRTRC